MAMPLIFSSGDCTFEELQHHADNCRPADHARHVGTIAYRVDGMSPGSAGRRRSKALEIPGNGTLVRMPPRSPEPGPAEQVSACLEKNFLQDRCFPAVENVGSGVRDARERFRNDAPPIASVTARKRAQRPNDMNRRTSVTGQPPAERA